MVGPGEGGAEIAALVGGHQRVELQIQAQGELELRRKRLSAAEGLGARIPTGDGSTGYLERVEAVGRGRRCADHPRVPSAVGGCASARASEGRLRSLSSDGCRGRSIRPDT